MSFLFVLKIYDSCDAVLQFKGMEHKELVLNEHGRCFNQKAKNTKETQIYREVLMLKVTVTQPQKWFLMVEQRLSNLGF